MPEFLPRQDLGFVIAERVVGSHGGFLVTEEPVDGTVSYRLFLPLAATGSAAPEPRGPDSPAATFTESRLRSQLLLVDDEVNLLRTLGGALKHHGYDVLTAQEGNQAINLFRDNVDRVGLVVCDLGMPQVSGWDVFRAIREINPHVPVLVMSGHLEPKMEAAVARSGASGFLQKPFSIVTVLRRISHFLGRPNPKR